MNKLYLFFRYLPWRMRFWWKVRQAKKLKKKTKKTYYVLVDNKKEIRVLDNKQLKQYNRVARGRVKKPDILWKRRNSVFVI